MMHNNIVLYETRQREISTMVNGQATASVLISL